MTDEDEFAARSQLKWTREGDAWILLYRRRRMGRVVPDPDYPGMWRSPKPGGRLSHIVLVQRRRACTGRKGGRLRSCKRPLKMPSKTGVSESNFVTHAFFEAAETGMQVLEQRPA
jgi:hypothetical protein